MCATTRSRMPVCDSGGAPSAVDKTRARREGGLQTLSNLSIGAIENFPFLFITLDRFSGRAAFQKGLEIRLGGFENKMAFLNSYFTF